MLQYVSDIHLERGTEIIINPIADYLILAGDIGCPFESSYYELLKDVSGKFKYIFLITGNHEYYSKIFSMQETEAQIHNITHEFKNIIFLQNKTFDIPDTDITVFGTTLWTPISAENYEMNRIFISDYRCIPDFTIEERNRLHNTAHESIKNLDKTKKYIVITHMVPHIKLLSEKHKDNLLNSSYICTIPELDEAHVLAVVYGHTHIASIKEKYYCNPVGYPGENQNYSTESKIFIKS